MAQARPRASPGLSQREGAFWTVVFVRVVMRGKLNSDEGFRKQQYTLAEDLRIRKQALHLSKGEEVDTVDEGGGLFARGPSDPAPEAAEAEQALLPGFG